MKKLFIGLITLVLILGIGTSVYAANTDNGTGFFEQMLPFAKQMHPDLTDQQIQNMYDACHKARKQMMNNSEFRGNRMNNSEFRGNRMNFN